VWLFERGNLVSTGVGRFGLVIGEKPLQAEVVKLVPPVDDRQGEVPFARGPVLTAALIVLIAHVLCINRYGFFRDELYYLSCAQHMAWGYVDHPPFCVAVAKLFTTLFGENLAALRIPGILSISTTVVLSALIAREMGASRRAQTMTALAIAIAPVYHVVGHIFAMNGLDVALWTLAAYVWVRVIKHESLRGWALLGLIVGIAMLNKISVLWLMCGLLVALITTSRRKKLITAGPYIALAIALAVASPFVFWQIQNGWPTAEFITNATRLKMVATPPWVFLGTQVVVMNPATAPLWIVGAIVGLRTSKWRSLAIAFVTVVGILLLTGKARENYLSTAYPLVLGLGAMAIDTWLNRFKPVWGKVAVGTMIVCGLITTVLILPVLPPTTLESIYAASPVQPSPSEKGEKSKLQGFADMFGWPELTSNVSKAFDSLPESERNGCAVITANYGEAAALRHFGVARGLPSAISGHNNFYLWGYNGWDGKSALLVGNFPPQVYEQFEFVELVGHNSAPLAVPEEAKAPIYRVRGLKEPVPDFWKSLRVFM